MISPEPVVAAVDVLEAIGEPRRRERGVGAQPPARVGEPADVHRGESGNRAHAEQCVPPSQREAAATLGVAWCFVLLAILLNGLHAHRPLPHFRG